MEAIILAGGMGTRLRKIVPDVPKVMATVGNRPFLELLLEHLAAGGVTKVVLAVGYLREVIVNHFGKSFASMELIYSEESKPLGTGGAIKKATNLVDGENVFVLNGDTYFALNYQEMWHRHIDKSAKISIALRYIDNTERYGRVKLCNDIITSFREKGDTGPGYINSGVYLIAKNIFDTFKLPEQFSFELDYLSHFTKSINPFAYLATGYFLDIGTPESYNEAQHHNFSL